MVSCHQRLYYPCETDMLIMDVAVINKVDSAKPAQVKQIWGNIEMYAPNAHIVLAEGKTKNG